MLVVELGGGIGQQRQHHEVGVVARKALEAVGGEPLELAPGLRRPLGLDEQRGEGAAQGDHAGLGARHGSEGSLELEQTALQQPDDDERGGPGQLGHRSAHAPADLGGLGDALLGVVEAALAHGAHGVVQWVEDHRAGLAQGVGHVLDAGYLLVHGGHVAGLEQHRDAPVADDHLHLAVAQAPAQLEKLDAVAQLVGDRVRPPPGEQRAAEDVLERLGGGAILVGGVLLAGQRDGLVR